MSKPAHHTFETPEQLHAWLQANHASETELWVRIFKKATGQPSVTWDDCVVAAIAWGWIDGLRNALDDTSFLQRLTPRRALQLVAKERAACRTADNARAHASRWPGARRGRAQRWPLDHRLRRQCHHGDARRLFGSAAARPRCPGFLRHSQTPEPVHHLPPAAERQAAGNPAEADGGAVGEVGAGRKPLSSLLASVVSAPAAMKYVASCLARTIQS